MAMLITKYANTNDSKNITNFQIVGIDLHEK